MPGLSVEIGWKIVLRFVFFMLLVPVVLFVSAGRFDWVMGWIYVALVVLFTIVGRFVVFRKNPDLIAERSQFTKAEGTKIWDKTIAPLLAVFAPFLVVVAAGLDMRFGWSPQLSLGVQAVAMILVVFGYLVATWAMIVNRFFSGVVRIQKDRDHRVVVDGPYRYVRHPAYVSGIIIYPATALALGSLWALAPAFSLCFWPLFGRCLRIEPCEENLTVIGTTLKGYAIA